MRNVFNFSAGPAVLPESVLQEAADEMLNYKGSGMSVMEISHRSALFQSIIDETEYDLRTLMNIPDDYEVLFLHGGASLQFSMIPMNFMKNRKADYILSGYWAKKRIRKQNCLVKFTLLLLRRIQISPAFRIAVIWILHRMQIISICAKTVRFTALSSISCQTARGKLLSMMCRQVFFLNR